tara:strand:- start:461 stop:685 length:225 start_codon:yes stop_codon:yes gene_type:complete
MDGGLDNMSNATHGGKGDRARIVNLNKFNDNFDAIFNKQQAEKEDGESKEANDKHPAKGDQLGRERKNSNAKQV